MSTAAIGSGRESRRRTGIFSRRTLRACLSPLGEAGPSPPEISVPSAQPSVMRGLRVPVRRITVWRSMMAGTGWARPRRGFAHPGPASGEKTILPTGSVTQAIAIGRRAHCRRVRGHAGHRWPDFLLRIGSDALRRVPPHHPVRAAGGGGPEPVHAEAWLALTFLRRSCSVWSGGAPCDGAGSGCCGYGVAAGPRIRRRRAYGAGAARLPVLSCLRTP